MVNPLFDTNILIDYLRGIEAAKTEIARYNDPAISQITWMEVMVGAAPADDAPTRAFLSRFAVLGVDVSVAEEAVRLRRGRGLRLPDAIIWATARSASRLLVTRNSRDFPPDDPGVREPYRLTTP
jgi:predicted nucleic acid-binding protein